MPPSDPNKKDDPREAVLYSGKISFDRLSHLLAELEANDLEELKKLQRVEGFDEGTWMASFVKCRGEDSCGNCYPRITPYVIGDEHSLTLWKKAKETVGSHECIRIVQVLEYPVGKKTFPGIDYTLRYKAPEFGVDADGNIGVLLFTQYSTDLYANMEFLPFKNYNPQLSLEANWLHTDDVQSWRILKEREYDEAVQAVSQLQDMAKKARAPLRTLPKRGVTERDHTEMSVKAEPREDDCKNTESSRRESVQTDAANKRKKAKSNQSDSLDAGGKRQEKGKNKGNKSK